MQNTTFAKNAIMLMNNLWCLFSDEGYVCFALTKESMHKRNIAFFGPTTLRATHCYNMLRMAQIVPGDIVVDPLCGGGSILIEVCMKSFLLEFIYFFSWSIIKCLVVNYWKVNNFCSLSL